MNHMLIQEIKETYRTSLQIAKTNCEQCYMAFHDEQNADPNLVYTTEDTASFNERAMNALQGMVNIPLINKNFRKQKQLLEKLKRQKKSSGQALKKCENCHHESKLIIESLALV